MESIKWLKKVYKVTGKLTDLDFDYAKDIHKDETKRELEKLVTSSQTEISDEEIEKSADYYGDRWIDAREAFYGFLEGAKWYREQLK